MARESSSVVSEDPRFLIHNATFTQQFANIYFMRLMQLREAVQEAASEKWKCVYPYCISKIVCRTDLFFQRLQCEKSKQNTGC